MDSDTRITVLSEQNLSSQRHQEINMASTSYANNPTMNLPCEDLIRGPKRDYIRIAAPLYEASIRCDWEAAKNILIVNPELVRYSITENGETALHIAASAKGLKKVDEFVRNLVEKMEKADLELVNKHQNTALHLAASAGNIGPVKIMVEKNRALVAIPGGGGNMMPLYAAALFGHYEMVKYLYDNSHELQDDGWTYTNRGWLLGKCCENDMFGKHFR
ncbi:ankyrin repeat-containing domain, PGG domain protein [Tanacetum coccineum]